MESVCSNSVVVVIIITHKLSIVVAIIITHKLSIALFPTEQAHCASQQKQIIKELLWGVVWSQRTQIISEL